jgi:hypothetical protein
MANVFSSAPSQDQIVATAIDTQVKVLANAQRNVYNALTKLIYQNSQFRDEYEAYDYAAVFDAYDAYGSIALSSVELLDLLRLVKASLNWLEAGTITTDDISPATITF